MPRYRPGELDQRVTFKRETLTPDGMGGNTVSLADVVTVAAKAIPMSGNEREDFGQVHDRIRYKFVIRRRSDLLENDRLVWRGIEFNVRSLPDLDPRSMYTELEAERGVAQ